MSIIPQSPIGDKPSAIQEYLRFKPFKGLRSIPTRHSRLAALARKATKRKSFARPSVIRGLKARVLETVGQWAITEYGLEIITNKPENRYAFEAERLSDPHLFAQYGLRLSKHDLESWKIALDLARRLHGQPVNGPHVEAEVTLAMTDLASILSDIQHGLPPDDIARLAERHAVPRCRPSNWASPSKI